MGAVMVNMCRIVCDTCGKARASLTVGTTAARIEAANEGWKFVQYDIKGKGLQRRVPDGRHPNSYSLDKKVPRQWDACPACPLPSVEEAMEITKGRRQDGDP